MLLVDFVITIAVYKVISINKQTNYKIENIVI